MQNLVFWGSWGGKFGVVEGDKSLQIRISLHFSSHLLQIDLHTKFHQNRMKNAQVSILGSWGGKFGVIAGLG